MQSFRASTNRPGLARAIGHAEWDDRAVTSRRKKPERERDRLAPYRRVRTPMPPPQKAIPDRRRELEEEQARRELEEGVWGAQGASADARAVAPQEEGEEE